jgi:hypothetical protein
MRRAVLLVLLVAGCDPVSVEVAHLDGGELLQHPCADNVDCRQDEFCDKEHCTDPHGSCTHRPICMGMDGYQPVCGCNGVTYWNDCLRKVDGASLESSDECSTAKSCNGNGDCPPGPFATCARVSQVSCPSSGATGVCWGVPPQCPPGQPANVENCSGGACMDLCGALKSGQPALLEASCP